VQGANGWIGLITFNLAQKRRGDSTLIGELSQRKAPSLAMLAYASAY
jgi:hypothetical protein